MGTELGSDTQGVLEHKRDMAGGVDVAGVGVGLLAAVGAKADVRQLTGGTEAYAMRWRG